MAFSDWVAKWIYQMAHIAAGALIALFVGAMWGPIYGGLANAGVSGIKEFIFDPLTETPALSGGIKGDAVDFGFFNIGGAIGMILAYIVRRHCGN